MDYIVNTIYPSYCPVLGSANVQSHGVQEEVHLGRGDHPQVLPGMESTQRIQGKVPGHRRTKDYLLHPAGFGKA